MKDSLSKVFGIGLSRTGTTSLTKALTELSYRSLHFPHDPLTQTELMRYYSDSSKPLVLTVAERYDALTDTPIASVFRELANQYPTSRFILTTRSEEKWLDSCEQYFARVMEPMYTRWGTAEAIRYCRAVNARVYGSPHFNREAFSRTYTIHFRNVTRYFDRQPDRLLCVDICDGQGWPELCRFLNCAVPAVAFPSENRLAQAEAILAAALRTFVSVRRTPS